VRETRDARTAVHVDALLAHPPATVWRALTDPALLASWLMPNDFAPVVGHEFTFRAVPQPAAGFDGVVRCRVLALEPDRLLRISWRGGHLDTTVTWRLVPEGRGTRLLLDHEGFDPDDELQRRALRGLGSGWRGEILRRLGQLLGSGAPSRGGAHAAGPRAPRFGDGPRYRGDGTQRPDDVDRPDRGTARSRREETVMASGEGHDEAGAVEGANDVDDVKRKFREALERKQGKRSGGVADEGEDRRKVSEAHGPAHTQRQFRRKSGG
jgi:uncharacterized protein YndB with AHSA1/START domain